MKNHRALLFAFLSSVFCGLACAQATPRFKLNIEPQPLGSALMALGEQSGIQVLMKIEEGTAERLTAPSLVGEFTVQGALSKLLMDTGLTYELLNDRTVRVSAAGPKPTAAIGRNEAIRVAQATGSSSIDQSKPEATKGDTLEEVIVSVFGRGVQEAARAVPQSIDVFQRDFLDTINARILDDVVRFVPNAMADSGGFGPNPLYSYVFVRGFLATSTWNGLGFRENTSPPNMASVERIEVLKGPASVLYGSMEPGAVMNIVTKRPQSTFAAEGSLRFGSYNDVTVTSDIGGPFSDRIRARLNAAYTRTDTQLDHAEMRDLFVAPSIEFDLTDRTLLAFDVTYEKREYPKGWLQGSVPRSVVGGIGGTNPFGTLPISANLSYDEGITGAPGFTEPHEWRKNLDANARLSHRFGADGGLSMNVALSYHRDDRDEVGIRTLGLAADNRSAPRLYVIYNGDPTVYKIAHVDFGGGFDTGPIGHQMTFGVDYRRADSPFNQNYLQFGLPPLDIFNPAYGGIVLPDTIPFNRTSYEEDTKGYFVQDRMSYGKLHLLLGARLTDYDRRTTSTPFGRPTRLGGLQDKVWTPQVGVLYDATDKVSLFASRAESFVPRSAFSQSRGVTLVVPEKSVQYETGVKALLGQSGMSVNAALFRIEKQDILITDPRNPFDVIPIGGVVSKGLELSVDGQPMTGLTLFAGYGYNKTEIVQADLFEGKPFYQVPKQTFSLMGRYEVQGGPLRRLGMSGSLTFSDSWWAYGYNAKSPAWTRLNVGVTYPFSEKVDVGVSVNNLLDQQLYGVNSLDEIVHRQERTYFGTVTVRF